MRAFLYKIRVFLWGHPPETKAERKLLLKIDFFILSFTCLLYWSNHFNRTNFQNAYVSGMQLDLNFQGNRYSVVNTLFTVGYIIGQIPNNLMLQIVPANYWTPSMAVLWATLSMCLAAARNPGDVMAIRFLQGIVENWLLIDYHLEQKPN